MANAAKKIICRKTCNGQERTSGRASWQWVDNEQFMLWQQEECNVVLCNCYRVYNNSNKSSNNSNSNINCHDCDNNKVKLLWFPTLNLLHTYFNCLAASYIWVCEYLTVCGWVLCNYLPWLGFLFWVHSKKFHTEIVCPCKIEVESFWLLIYLPMRSGWWKSPSCAHNHTHKVKQSHTKSHLYTHSHSLSHSPRLFNRPCEVSLPTRSASVCKLCCYHHLRTCHSLCSSISLLLSSSALLITLISLCIVAVNWRCPWRALRCEADRAGQYELGLLLLHLSSPVNSRFQCQGNPSVRPPAQLVPGALQVYAVCVPGLMNENYKDALPRRSLCHRFAFNDTRTGYLLT